jgi:SAM-dependent methyltransferase
MKNPEAWRPSKFVFATGRLRASRDPAQVAPASWFVADLLAERYQRLLKEHARGRLLDLGAGQVPLYGCYRELVTSATCVDWSKSPHPCPHIDHYLDLDEPLPLRDHAFDTVLLTDVLEHTRRPESLFREIARLLAPQGKLILTVPFFYWIHEAPHDYARYTSFMLNDLSERSGLTVVELDATGGSPEVLLDFLGKHLAWSKPLATVHGTLARWSLALPGVSVASQRSARWFPLGYVLVAQKPPMASPSRPAS